MLVFSFMAGVALKSSVVLAMAWLAAWILRKRPAAMRHLMWTAAAASVLALPLLSLVLPAVRVPASRALLSLAPAITFQVGAIAGAPAMPQLGPGTRQPGPRAAHPPIDWPRWLVLLWAAGAAVGFLQIALAARAIAAIRRRALPHPALLEVGPLARTIGIGHPVEVLEAPAGSMPMTCGLFRPAIFLPADAGAWSAERRRMVLLHELAHVRRGDTGAHLLARLALVVNWWNPLAWLAWRESVKERERAADDLVLLAGERASTYAGLLLEVASAIHSKPPVAWAALAMARRSQLEGRLVAILDPALPRHSVARVSALAAALLAIAMVAPFAAMRAQDQPASQGASPVDVDATIRATTDYTVLDQAAREFVQLQQYDAAQKLLEAALQLREKSAGPQGAEYAQGLTKLGDLARLRKQDTAAADFYHRAGAVAGNGAEAARPLTALGVMYLAKKDYLQARDYFQLAQAADSAHTGIPLTWMALTYVREGSPVQAESGFQQAMAAEDPASADAATTLELYATFLKEQGREGESDTARDKAVSIRKALGVQSSAEVRFRGGNGGAPSTAAQVRPDTKPAAASSGVYKVGNGVAAPSVLHKQEPTYTEEARVAKYQGTVVLKVEIEPDGTPHNIQIVRGLGFRLDDQAVDAVNQWKFKPGTKDGVPVTVAAQIEVNFRLL